MSKVQNGHCSVAMVTLIKTLSKWFWLFLSSCLICNEKEEIEEIQLVGENLYQHSIVQTYRNSLASNSSKLYSSAARSSKYAYYLFFYFYSADNLCPITLVSFPSGLP